MFTFQYPIAENKRKQIEEQYNYISDRLRELEAEKEDLKQYQSLDKQRRALEYSLWNKDAQDANGKIEEVIQPLTTSSQQMIEPYSSSAFLR